MNVKTTHVHTFLNKKISNQINKVATSSVRDWVCCCDLARSVFSAATWRDLSPSWSMDSLWWPWTVVNWTFRSWTRCSFSSNWKVQKYEYFQTLISFLICIPVHFFCETYVHKTIKIHNVQVLQKLPQHVFSWTVPEICQGHFASVQVSLHIL